MKLPICLYSSFLAAAAAASSTASLALAAGFDVSVGVAVSCVPVGVGDGFGAVYSVGTFVMASTSTPATTFPWFCYLGLVVLFIKRDFQFIPDQSYDISDEQIYFNIV